MTVTDLTASREFYDRLGFTPLVGDAAQGWLVLKNADAVIGLFQGMFDRSTLTFNPGWDSAAQPVETFTDVRALQRELKAAGLSHADRPGREPDPDRPAPLSQRGLSG